MPLDNKYVTEVSNDIELLNVMQLMLPIINTNKTVLGMTATEVTNLTNQINNFATQLTALNNARLTVKSARVNKDAQKDIARQNLVDYVAKWRANLAVPDALLAQLFVAPHSTPGSGSAPVTPTDLVATANGNGTVDLKWKKGGNRGAVTYLIEYRKGSTGTWKPLIVVSKVKFQAIAELGQQISFRVKAQKGTASSLPTDAVTVWEGGNNNTLSVAA